MFSPPTGAIGSSVHPGAMKVVEEAGETVQVLGKLLAFPDGNYPDGSDLNADLIEELGDLKAAIDFYSENAGIENKVAERRRYKIRRFREWHDAEVMGP